MQNKICLNCEQSFKIRESQIRKLFCSDKCREEANKRQKEELKYLKKEESKMARYYEVIKLKTELLVAEESIGFTKVFGNKPKNVDIKS